MDFSRKIFELLYENRCIIGNLCLKSDVFLKITLGADVIIQSYTIFQSCLKHLFAISSETARHAAAKFCMQMRDVCLQHLSWVLCQ